MIKISEFLFVAFPKALSGFGTIALNLVLLRLMGAEHFGIVSLCVATILLVDSIIGSAIDLSVMKLAPAERLANPQGCLAIQRSALYLKLGGGMILVAPLAVAGGWLSEALFHESGHESLLALSALAALAMLLLRSTQVQLQVEGRFRLYGLVELLHALLRFGGVAVLMVIGTVTPLSVVSCLAAAPLTILVLWLAAGARGLLSPPALDRQWTRRLLEHLRWTLLTFGLGTVISRLDLFLLARWAHLADVGIYSAALTIAMMAQLAGVYIAVVTSPKVGPLLKEGRFDEFYWRFQLGLVLLCVLGYAGFRLFWSFGGSQMFPEAYSSAGELIFILLPGALAGLITFPLTLTYLMFVRPRFLFFLDCITLPGILSLYYILVPKYGATGAAFVTVGANVLRAVIAQIAAWHLLRQKAVYSAASGQPAEAGAAV